jgi:hypothetical protein
MGKACTRVRDAGDRPSSLINLGISSNCLLEMYSQGEKGGKRKLRTDIPNVAVQRFAPEPCGSLAFKPRGRERRAFDRVELAERDGFEPPVLEGLEPSVLS